MNPDHTPQVERLIAVLSRKLSAAVLRAIIEATKKRWAEQRKREREEAKHQEEINARRIAAMEKARKALTAKRKAAKKAAA